MNRVRRTPRQAILERQLGVAMTSYLYHQLRAGVTQTAIAERMGVHPTTVSSWARKMGYGRADIYEAAWRSGLIQIAQYEGESERRGGRRAG